ncbi:WhiB family transcriptional regulator (plasmid) [Streptomyces sp. NBC_01463]
MTSTQAQHTRRAALQAAVDAGALCAQPGAPVDAFFRADDEPLRSWNKRRKAALAFCGACPVRAACHELALREGDGRAHTEDMVRGGSSGSALAAERSKQAQRLKAAVAADGEPEWKRLVNLSVQLRREAVKNPDGVGGHRTQGRAQHAQNILVRSLATEIQQIRTARRARNGWGVAA